MSIIIIIPAIVCLFALFRDSVQKTFLNVVLPVYLLLPLYYYWKVNALPPLDFTETVLLPLGLLIVFKELKAMALHADGRVARAVCRFGLLCGLTDANAHHVDLRPVPEPDERGLCRTWPASC